MLWQASGKDSPANTKALEMPKYVISCPCSSFKLCIKPAREGWVLKQNLNVVLRVDSRHKIPKEQHPSYRVCLALDPNPVSSAEQPLFPQPWRSWKDSPGLCKHFSGHHLAAVRVLLREFCKMRLQGREFMLSSSGPGGSCSGNCSLQPFPKHNRVPDGLK